MTQAPEISAQGLTSASAGRSTIIDMDIPNHWTAASGKNHREPTISKFYQVVWTPNQEATSGEFRTINFYLMVVRIYHFKKHLLKEFTKFTCVGHDTMFRRIWDFR